MARSRETRGFPHHLLPWKFHKGSDSLWVPITMAAFPLPADIDRVNENLAQSSRSLILGVLPESIHLIATIPWDRAKFGLQQSLVVLYHQRCFQGAFHTFFSTLSHHQHARLLTLLQGGGQLDDHSHPFQRQTQTLSLSLPFRDFCLSYAISFLSLLVGDQPFLLEDHSRHSLLVQAFYPDFW